VVDVTAMKMGSRTHTSGLVRTHAATNEIAHCLEGPISKCRIKNAAFSQPHSNLPPKPQ